MTDHAEREAQIRQIAQALHLAWSKAGGHENDLPWDELAPEVHDGWMAQAREAVMPDLDEARAEIARLTDVCEGWARQDHLRQIDTKRLQDSRSTMERATGALCEMGGVLRIEGENIPIREANLIFVRGVITNAIEEAEREATDRERSRCATIDGIDLPRLLAEARAVGVVEGSRVSDAERADVARIARERAIEDLGYQRTFNAIADATRIEAGHIAISVAAFIRALATDNKNPAEAGCVDTKSNR